MLLPFLAALLLAGCAWGPTRQSQEGRWLGGSDQKGWHNGDLIDDLGTWAGTGAMNEIISPAVPLAFPYHKIKANLMASDCGQQFWIRFDTDLVDLDSSETVDVSARLDSGPVQTWPALRGADYANYLHFRNLSWVMEDLKQAKTLEITVPYREAGMHFKWSMEGFSEAIANTCS